MAVSTANDLSLNVPGPGAGRDFAHIQQLSTAGTSKVSLDVVLHEISGTNGTVNVKLQGSNDHVNWRDIPLTGGVISMTVVKKETRIGTPVSGFAFVQVEYEFTSDDLGIAVLSSSLGTGQ